MTLLVLTGVIRRLRGMVVGRGRGAAGYPGAKITHFNLQNYILPSRSSSSSSVEPFGRQGWMDGWMEESAADEVRGTSAGFYLGLAASGKQHNGLIQFPRCVFFLLCAAVRRGSSLKASTIFRTLLINRCSAYLHQQGEANVMRGRGTSVMHYSTCVGDEEEGMEEEEEGEYCA